MKRYRALIAVLFAFSFIVKASAQENESGKIVVEITKEINGEKRTFKGEYENAEQMRADPNYQEFAGSDNNMGIWFEGEDVDAFPFDLNNLKNLQGSFFDLDLDNFSGFGFFDHDEDSNFSQHQFFKLDDIDLDQYKEEMKKLGIEMESLVEKLEEGVDSKMIVISKRVKVSDVDGEFGEKGNVKKSNLLELDDLTFFPNPSSNGRFKVRFKVPEENELAIKVYDLEGKEIFNRYFERFGGMYSETLDLSGQKDGIYLLEISQGKKRVTKKIIIN